MLGADVADYQSTKGSLHFAVDEPLPPDLIARLVAARMCELLVKLSGMVVPPDHSWAGGHPNTAVNDVGD